MGANEFESIQQALGGKQLNTSEAATLLGVSTSTAKRLIYERKIHALKIGGDWRIPADSPIAFHAGQLEQSQAPHPDVNLGGITAVSAPFCCVGN